MRPAPYVPDLSRREMWVLKKCAFAIVVIFISVFVAAGVVVLVAPYVRSTAPLYCGRPPIVGAIWAGR